jgi:steroid delta-isomerase-like uncharacterized protein
MSTEQNKAAARRFMESWNDGAEAAWQARDEFFSPQVVFHFPGFPEPIRGREAVEQVIGMFSQSFSDDHLTVEDQIAEGDKVATRWTWAFTHTGPFQGLPATGKRATISGINWETFEGGKLVGRRLELDQVGMLQQLGVMPAPGQSGSQG